MKILVIECDERVRALLEAALRDAGHEVSSTAGALDSADHVVLVAQKVMEQERLRGDVGRLRDALKWAGVSEVPGTVAQPPTGPNESDSTVGAAADEDLSVKRRTARLERTLIRRALVKTGGNRTRAARLLELSHRALLYKIREYGLQS